VVPVGESKYELVIVLEIGIGIIDDDGPTKPVWILTISMAMIEVCAGLTDLDLSANLASKMERLD